MNSNTNLISAIVRLDLEYLTMELGKTMFLSVTTITEIEEVFGVNLKEIDREIDVLKDTKYKYEEFCDLCDEGKEDEYKLLSKVFEYSEIQKFAGMIIKSVSEELKVRINRL